MPRPICVNCKIEFRCKKNSFLVRDPESGPAPSTYWSGDKFQCPGCGVEIVVGFGRPMDALTGEAMAGLGYGCLEFTYR